MDRMRNTIVGRGLFGLAVLGALGFGASQAAAAPRSSTGKEAYCSYLSCRNMCIAAGRPSGYCESGICLCD
jgi:hypothetical protein